MAQWVFLNDSFVKDEAAVLHYRDLSFQRGYGIFDFFRLRQNDPLFLDDHFDRFHFSASEMHLPVPLNRSDIKKCIYQLIERNGLPNTGIRISLTGGYSEDGFTPGKPNLVISQHTFSSPTKDQRQKGIRLLSYPYQRQLPQVKTIDYLMAIWLQPFRLQNGADDILYYHNSFITECPRSNFFLVAKEGTVVTPAEGILKGITRKKVIELARQIYAVEERPIRVEEIETAREAFITSTTKQLLPVASIDQKVFTERSFATTLFKQFKDAYGC